MNTKTAISILLAATLVGCATKPQPQPKRPFLPPLPPTGKIVKPKFGPTPWIKTPEIVMKFASETGLGLEPRGTNVLVFWPTNGNSVLLYSTNIALPMAQWTLPAQTAVRQTNGGRYELTFPMLPQCFFRLMSVPTNEVALAWNYDFDRSPRVNHFVLYCGPASRNYTTNVTVGKTLFATMPTPFATNYYAATAMEDGGLQSEYSNEAVFVKPTPP